MKNYCVGYFCAVIVLSFAISLSGCYSAREKAYYADMTNFITEEATVDNIIYEEKHNYIVLWLSGIDPSYQSSAFIIRRENVTVAIENDFFDKVRVGDTIVYTSAPGYFGDGYFMPIVGISTKDSVILDVEIGYQNLMNSYK
ncbi:MAG: hypothetical protein IJN16_02575 [Lachnospiraceae bacterium]|nr:hypothetical protein [Lachnospiraceae bacterium]